MDFEKDNLNFVSKWFKDEIESNIEIYNITDECKYWHLVSKSEMFQDYTVIEAKLDENDKSIIILNSELKIEMDSVELANKVYENYFKKYSGDITKDLVLINITKLKKSNLYENCIDKIDKKLNSTNETINNIIYKIYGLESKAELINNYLNK